MVPRVESLKRVGILLLQLIVTAAFGMYFTTSKSEHRSRMLCDRPIELG